VAVAPRDTTAPTIRLTSHRCRNARCRITVRAGDARSVGVPTGVRRVRVTVATRVRLRGRARTRTRTLSAKPIGAGVYVVTVLLPRGRTTVRAVALDHAGNRSRVATGLVVRA
jgi:hypothetical protein